MAAPRGFCAGVERAIAAVEDALALHGAPVYVRRPIVHNIAVVRQLEAMGAVFVQELDEAPQGAVVVLSAHGVARRVGEEAARRGLKVYDAVCPLVAKVHRHVLRYRRDGRHVILIGHRGHPEIEGTLGQLPRGAATLVSSSTEAAALAFPREARLAYAVQTTFSVAEAEEVIAVLAGRFPDLAAPSASDICYATTNRQAAIGALAPQADAVIVVGEKFSSNARRLAEVAAQACSAVQLIPESSQLEWTHLPRDGGTIALTAAASTPKSSVADVIELLGTRYRVSASEAETVEESVRFRRVAIPPASP